MPQDHPLREIRRLTDIVLRSLNEEFDSLYSASGRPSIAPEYILRALLLQAFYSVRSERQLVEQLDYNLLFRWFVGLGTDDAVWNHAVFSKNRDRLLTSDVAQQFFAAVLEQAKGFMSDEHFTVDGTLIQAWASQKSFRPKDGDGGPDDHGTNFHGQKRSNETHQSTTDPEARLYKKSYGKESKLAYLGHVNSCVPACLRWRQVAEQAFWSDRVAMNHSPHSQRRRVSIKPCRNSDPIPSTARASIEVSSVPLSLNSRRSNSSSDVIVRSIYSDNSQAAQYLAGLKNTLGDYLIPPAGFTAMQRLVTNQIPQPGAGSSAFVGDWSELALGLRASLQIEVSREGSYFDNSLATPGYSNAFSKDQTLCRAILRADWQPLHTAAFVELTGITG